MTRSLPVLASVSRILMFAAAASVASAQVTVSSRTGVVTLPSNMTLGFSATHADGVARRWHWSIDEMAHCGTFVSAQGRARIAYRAPLALWAQTFHIRATAEDGSCTGATAITVLPRAGALGAGKGLSAHAKDQAMHTVGLMRTPHSDVPTLERFGTVVPGHPDGSGWDVNKHKTWALAAVSDPDPDFAALNGQWLAGTMTGIVRLSGPGASSPIPLRGQLCAAMKDTDVGLFPKVMCLSIATRPAGGAPGRHVVVLLRASLPMAGTFICHENRRILQQMKLVTKQPRWVPG
jgi:hypothetical protein